MYILGHTAFAYLLLRPFISFKDDKFGPEILLFIFIFANIVDAVHFGHIRVLAHNPIATFLFAGFWIVILNRVGLLRKSYLPFVLVAAASHIVGDYLFSEYHFLIPFSEAGFSVFGFNSYVAMVVESILAALFILVFSLSGDLKLMSQFIKLEKKIFINEFNFKNLFSPKFYYFDLYLLFYLFSLGQFVILIRINHELINTLTWFTWAYMVLFFVYLVVLSKIFFGNRNNKDCLNS